jgi:hypothetical protein
MTGSQRDFATADMRTARTPLDSLPQRPINTALNPLTSNDSATVWRNEPFEKVKVEVYYTTPGHQPALLGHDLVQKPDSTFGIMP